MTMFLAAQRLIPTQDSDVFLYAVGGLALLIVGGFLIRYANKRRR